MSASSELKFQVTKVVEVIFLYKKNYHNFSHFNSIDTLVTLNLNWKNLVRKISLDRFAEWN